MRVGQTEILNYLKGILHWSELILTVCTVCIPCVSVVLRGDNLGAVDSGPAAVPGDRPIRNAGLPQKRKPSLPAA